MITSPARWHGWPSTGAADRRSARRHDHWYHTPPRHLPTARNRCVRALPRRRGRPLSLYTATPHRLGLAWRPCTRQTARTCPVSWSTVTHPSVARWRVGPPSCHRPPGTMGPLAAAKARKEQRAEHAESRHGACVSAPTGKLPSRLRRRRRYILPLRRKGQNGDSANGSAHYGWLYTRGTSPRMDPAPAFSAMRRRRWLRPSSGVFVGTRWLQRLGALTNCLRTRPDLIGMLEYYTEHFLTSSLCYSPCLLPVLPATLFHG